MAAMSVDDTTRDKAAPRSQAAELLTVGVPGLLADRGEIEFRDFLALIFATSSAIQTARRLIARRFDLSATELAVFLAVGKLEDAPSIGQIAQHLRVSATNVTTDVKRLVKARLLEKHAHPVDARAVQIVITSEGDALMRRLTPLLREANDRLFSGMTHAEMITLTKVMEQVIRASNAFATDLRDRQDYGLETTEQDLTLGAK